MFRQLWHAIIGLGIAVILGTTHHATFAQTNPVWNVQYFNNTSFSGLTTTGTLNNLNVNWGRNAPAAGFNGDNWTARFQTVAYFNQGTYRFTVNADDGVRLLVHGQVWIDTLNNPKPGQTISVDVTMTAAYAGIQVDFREYAGDAYLMVSWQQISGNTVYVPPAQPAPAGAWLAQYFNNTSLAGSPNATTTFPTLNVNWGHNAPASGIGIDNWTARFSTTAYFNAGTYRFNFNADDAIRLYVQNRLVIDTISAPQPDRWLSVDVPMTAGNASIQVDYREYIGPAFLNLSWTQLNTNQQPVNPAGPVVTVNTNYLNFRHQPFVGNNLISQLSLNATYPVIGRTSAGDWYQIQVGNTVGWVFARYVNASNTANVPVV